MSETIPTRTHVQARAHGWFGTDASLETLREAVAAAFPPERFEPRAG